MNNLNKQYLHHLKDTLILLGCKIKFVSLLEQPKDINKSDIDDLRKFNCKLLDETKEKLSNINTIKIKVSGE